ncbi:MAG: hypothetical protein AAB401_02140, partial [Acidobacteriota bacterium]
MHVMNPPNVRWEWIGEGWQMFAEQWKVWVLQMLIVGAIFAVPAVPFYGMMLPMQLEAAQGQQPELPVLFFPLALGFGLLAIL